MIGLFRKVAVELFLGPVETDALRALAAPRRWLLVPATLLALAALLVLVTR